MHEYVVWLGVGGVIAFVVYSENEVIINGETYEVGEKSPNFTKNALTLAGIAAVIAAARFGYEKYSAKKVPKELRFFEDEFEDEFDKRFDKRFETEKENLQKKSRKFEDFVKNFN